MILSEEQYLRQKESLAHMTSDREKLCKELKAKGKDDGYIEQFLTYRFMMYDDVKWDVEEYERVKNGEFDKENVMLDQIGKHLIRLRIWRGLSQEELAKKVGFTLEQIQKYERFEYQGLPFSKLNEILQVLGVEKITIVPGYSDPNYGEFMNKRRFAMQEMSNTKDEMAATSEEKRQAG
ncbi:helix-turn-helix transcriptional regulator [Thermoflavimicrobium dichotomicum]|nr:helix-turn-helix transcriptional regulator [Thermoflavimicrobium dichotomicum]